jgi:hypothetical protein
MCRLILLFFLFLLAFSVKSQTSYSGNVLDAGDKKYLEGVRVSVIGKDSVLTNARGHFSLFAVAGDTLRLSFPGFIEQKIVLDSERYLLLQIQDRARLLPTFTVKSEPYSFRFKDRKLILVENEPETEKKLGQQVGVGLGTSTGGGLTIYGPISYFSKRATQLRKYDEKLEWIRRRTGYLEIIDSDSVRSELMGKNKLSRESYDELIIRFNQFHNSHQFLDWSRDRVYSSLRDFIQIEARLMD